MIRKITQKEYNAFKRNRKMAGRGMYPGIAFKGANNKYYLQTEDGATAAREVIEFKKKLTRQKNAQTSLLEQTKLI